MPTVSQTTRSSASASPFFFASPYKGDVRNAKAKPGGVLHVRGDTASAPTIHYWLENLSLAEANAKYFFAIGFTNYSFTSYTSSANWNKTYPNAPITGIAPITQPPPPPSPRAPAAPPRPPPTPAASVTTVSSVASAHAPPTPPATVPPPNTPAPASSTAQSVPPVTIPEGISIDRDLFNQLLTLLNAQLQQRQQQPAPVVSPVVSAPPIPQWDGTPDTVSLFLEALADYKYHVYFTSANIDWEADSSPPTPQNIHIRSELLRTLKPFPILYSFLGKPQYERDGIRMLRDLIEKLNPTRPENLLNSVIELVGLQQAPNETGVQFMCRLRGLYSRLKDITISKIFTTLAIAGLDPELYVGLIMRYRAGDTSVTEASIYELGEEVEAEDTRRPITERGTSSSPSTVMARRASQDPTPPPPSTDPKPTISYPPSKAQKWKDIKAAFLDKEFCPTCFHRSDYHINVGCPALASLGLVIVKDEDKAAEIIADYKANTNKPPRPPSDDSTTADQDDDAASARRASAKSSSSKRKSKSKSTKSTAAAKASAKASAASASPQGGQLKSPPEQLSTQGGQLKSPPEQPPMVSDTNPYKIPDTMYEEYSSDEDDDEEFYLETFAT